MHDQNSLSYVRNLTSATRSESVSGNDSHQVILTSPEDLNLKFWDKATKLVKVLQIP